MSVENEALIRRWFDEVWNQGRTDAIEELLSVDSVAYGMGGAEKVLRGRDDFKAVHATFLGAFPNLTITVDQMVSDGDTVAVRFTCRGTHQGDQLGFAATHRDVEFSGMTFSHVRDGQITGGWNCIDLLSMLQQVQAVPQLL